jgi:hypothetical protein
MAHRMIPFSPQVQTAEDAENFLISDSGGVVFPAGNTIQVPGGFQVECYSFDGRRPCDPSVAPMVKKRSMFRVIKVSEDKTTATLEDKNTGFRFEAPRVLPQVCGGVVELEENQTFSAVVVGQFAGLRDALVEDGLHERKEFEGAPSDVRGWAPYNNPQKPAGKE